jgi:hypothetical protein
VDPSTKDTTAETASLALKSKWNFGSYTKMSLTVSPSDHVLERGFKAII